jgi:hypothetical protein
VTPNERSNPETKTEEYVRKAMKNKHKIEKKKRSNKGKKEDII